MGRQPGLTANRIQAICSVMDTNRPFSCSSRKQSLAHTALVLESSQSFRAGNKISESQQGWKRKTTSHRRANEERQSTGNEGLSK